MNVFFYIKKFGSEQSAIGNNIISNRKIKVGIQIFTDVKERY